MKLFLLLAALAFSAAPAFAAGNVLSLGLQNFSGETGKSLNGSYGYDLGFKSDAGSGAIRGSLGGVFTYSPAEITIGTVKRNATFYGAEFTAGFLIIPMGDDQISPYLEFAGSVGTAMLQIASPPTGTSAQSRSLTYGFQAGFGVQLPMGQTTQVRLSAMYTHRTASKLANQNQFELHSLAFLLSLVF